LPDVRALAFPSPLTGRFERLSNLPKMFGAGVPCSFGFAIGSAVFSVRDDMRIINNDGFLFLKCE
jgi:hypothetical protein